MAILQRTLLAAACASLPLFGALAAPAQAAAIASGASSIGSALSATDRVVEIRHVRKRHHRGRVYRGRAFGRGDDVGSIYRGPGTGPYGANSRTGQIYSKCMLDEGYGRTRPCDAGGGPN